MPTMIMGFMRHGYGEEASRIWQEMQNKGGRRPSSSSSSSTVFTTILNACASPDSLALGKLVHAAIVSSRLESNVAVATALVSMYGRCGSVDDSRRIFDKMPERNVVSWNAMITVYSRHQCVEQAFKLFGQMRRSAVELDKITFVAILNACRAPRVLAFGKLIHSQAICCRFASDVFVGNALVTMYGQCGSLENAVRTFNQMPQKDVVTWTVMIAGYAQHGYTKEACKLFQQMQEVGLKPNKLSLMGILNSCASPEALAVGKLVHAYIGKSHSEVDLLVGTALVSMYARCGSIKDAHQIFGMIRKRDIVSWNAMVAAYASHGYSEEAFKLFMQMQQEAVIPDKLTFISILNACGNPEDLALGKLVHAYILDRKIGLDDDIGTAIVTVYCKCWSIQDAWNVFDKMPSRNIVSWNSMIGAYAVHGYGGDAFKCFQQMQKEGVKPNKITFISILNACGSQESLALAKLIHACIVNFGIESTVVIGNALVSMYSRCRCIDTAWRIFNKMPKHDIISWNAMIEGYVQCGCIKEAFQVFEQMQHEDVKPDKVTLISILNACANFAALTQGKLIHSYIVDVGMESDIIVGTSLVHMYSRCGNIENAQRIFTKMPERNLISWNAMIAGYAEHGYGKEAVELFQRMQAEGLKPNEVTLINILCACSHAGLVSEGYGFFHCMHHDFAITPSVEHYNCMVDLLGRAGCLEEAEEFINRMPFQPNAVTWMTLLGSSRSYGFADGGKHAAECALQLDPRSAAVYIVLSKTYAAVHR